LGKIIGGRFPLAAITGKKDIIDHFDKSIIGSGKWLMMSTLPGNTIACIAGLKNLGILQRKGSYNLFYSDGKKIMDINRKSLDLSGVPYQVVGHPTLFEIVFSDKMVKNYRDVFLSNSSINQTFDNELREYGSFKTPTKLLPSLVLTEEDFELAKEAVGQATKAIISAH